MKVILSSILSLSFSFLLASQVAAKSSGTSMTFGLPLVGLGQSAYSFEWNTKWGGLGVELLGSGEYSYESESSETGAADELFEHEGMSEVAFLYSRYSNQSNMSGGYYAFGLGQRVMKAAWSKTPSENYAMKDTYAMDDQGRVTHRVQGSGTTMRVRGGYRYVADSMPLFVSIYAGLRSFNGSFSDVEDDESVGAAETTNEDLEAFGSKFKMNFEPGIELGLAF